MKIDRAEMTRPHAERVPARSPYSIMRAVEFPKYHSGSHMRWHMIVTTALEIIILHTRITPVGNAPRPIPTSIYIAPNVRLNFVQPFLGDVFERCSHIDVRIFTFERFHISHHCYTVHSPGRIVWRDTQIDPPCSIRHSF